MVWAMNGLDGDDLILDSQHLGKKPRVVHTAAISVLGKQRKRGLQGLLASQSSCTVNTRLTSTQKNNMENAYERYPVSTAALYTHGACTHTSNSFNHLHPPTLHTKFRVRSPISIKTDLRTQGSNFLWFHSASLT